MWFFKIINFQIWKNNYLSLPTWLKKQFYLLEQENNKEKINLLFRGSSFKFGTSGIRLKMGLGSNKFNEITLKKITLGFLIFLKINYSNLLNKGIIVGGDNRKFSQTFVKLICKICAQEKIKVFHFQEYRAIPTPFLNYLIKQYGFCAGIAITASHNPAIWNGFKVYNFQAQQFMEKETEIISKNIENIPWSFNLDFSKIDNSYIKSIPFEWTDNYLDLIIKKLWFFPKDQIFPSDILKKTKIIYSNLHGTGYSFTDHLLRLCGFEVNCVKEQIKNPDGKFKTVTAPNPEAIDAFDLAEEYNWLNQELIILNDADADRLGCAELIGKKYKKYTGNEIGIVLLYFLLKIKKKQKLLTKNSTVFFTLISSDLGEKIANYFGVKAIRTAPGFKYIMEKAIELKSKNKMKLVIAYEESMGYWLDDEITHEKDGISAALVLAQAKEVFSSQKQTFQDVLNKLFLQFGFHLNKTMSLTFKTEEAQKNVIKELMTFLRNKNFTWKINQKLVLTKKVDYLSSDSEIKTNLLKFHFSDHSWLGIRPSGTEPKVKIYSNIVDQISLENCKKKQLIIVNYLDKVILNQFKTKDVNYELV